jgi:hypothetical protein
MVRPLRHRQTKEAATDLPDLPPLRHIPTLPNPVVRREAAERQTEASHPSVQSANIGSKPFSQEPYIATAMFVPTPGLAGLGQTEEHLSYAHRPTLRSRRPGPARHSRLHSQTVTLLGIAMLVMPLDAYRNRVHQPRKSPKLGKGED